MSQNIDYKAILKAYPETISKEQLYNCAISASAWLSSILTMG